MMWIRTEKTGLINLNEVFQIQTREIVYLYTNIKEISYEEPKKNFQIIITSTNEIDLVIATYSSMERAKKEFDDLQEWISIETFRKGCIEVLHEIDNESENLEKALKTYSNVYIMPKE
jgi:hypothetical protein